MQKSKVSIWVALLAVLALLAAACGSDSDSTETGSDDTTDDSGDSSSSTDSEDDMSDEDMSDEDSDAAMTDLPGEGKPVTMARANWASGYLQAEIYRQILTEFGYDVSDPADLELGPQIAFQQMAEGEIDFWANSWYPGHLTWWDQELTDGTTVGDHIEKVPGLFEAAGVQGFLITKSVADEHSIISMQQINDTPELVELFDTDGNGKAEMFGCEDSYTCDEIIENMIAFYGWENMEQTVAGYDAMFAEALGLVREEKPMLIYTWTPSAYVTDMVPGDNVMWITMNPDSVLDDSNPTGAENGENHDQRPGFDGLGPEVCTQPCQLGWVPADIQVTANSEWAADNPQAIALMSQIKPSVIDISLLQVQQDAAGNSQEAIQEIATQWIADNRDLVDEWIANAS